MARPPAKRTTSSRKAGRGGARPSGKGKRKPRPSTWKGRLLRWSLWTTGIGLALFAGIMFYFEREAARIDISNLNEVPERTQVYDLRGRLVGVLHGENRIFIPISDVPPAFKEALLAREDNRFYEHKGVDWFGVLRAAFRNVREGDIVQGASTLTMQLARNRFALSGKNFQRKIVEAFLSRRIEARYSKDQILEAYLNIVYFGSGQYGLEQASRTYFEKPARALNLGESAMLVGIIRSPNRYSPFRNPEGAVAEMSMVLDRMVETDRLAPAAAVSTKQAPPAVRPPARRNPADSWAMDVIRKELELILDANNIAEGGLRVFTTLDLDLQRAAEDGLEEHLGAMEKAPGYAAPTRDAHTAALAGLAAGQDPPEPGYLQGAVVVLDNGTGGIRAMVGGRDVKQSRFNRATQAKRQVGSLFKPFVYTAAFEAGLPPNGALDDGPIRPGEIAGASRGWRPQNSDGSFGGMTSVAVGLARSRNTMAVRAGNIAGLQRVREMADRCGLASEIPSYPSVYLGSFECTLRDLTSAYTAFPNHGVRPRPYVVTEIQDRYGRRVYLATLTATPSFSPQAATTTSRMLEAVMRPGGTAAAAITRGVDFPAAGKTGTTDNYRDAWFVGYTGLLTTGVWVGFDERNRGLAQGYGSRLSLPVWVKVMRTAKDAGYQFGKLP